MTRVDLHVQVHLHAPRFDSFKSLGLTEAHKYRAHNSWGILILEDCSPTCHGITVATHVNLALDIHFATPAEHERSHQSVKVEARAMASFSLLNLRLDARGR